MLLHADVATCVRALSMFVDKCYGERSADDVFLRVDSGEHRTIACSRGVQQWDSMGPAILIPCISLRPGLKLFREEIEGDGVEPFALHGRRHAWPHGGYGKHHKRAIPSLRRELDGVSIVANPATTVALSPQGHVPTAEEISLLASVDVRIPKEEGWRWWASHSAPEEYVGEHVVRAV
ncbi:unnamed protein product, partial [Laminaria digitata]